MNIHNCSKTTFPVENSHSLNASLNVMNFKGLRFNKYLVYDTGATISVVNNKDILLNVKDATIEVSVADGATLEADCVGDLIIRVGIVSITLETTLYLPESSFNLVSLKQIEERGFNVLITKESVIVFNQNVAPTIIASRKKAADLYMGPQFSEESLECDFDYDGLADMLSNANQDDKDKSSMNEMSEYQEHDYSSRALINSLTEVDVLDVEISPYGVEQLLPTGDKNDIYNFHLMSNHMSIEKILLLQKYQGLVLHTSKESLQKIADCKVCLLSNAKQRSHNHHSERKASRRHERLHCDTLGPFRSENNKWYLTSVIDEHTGYIEGIITKDRKVKDLLIQRLKIWNNRFNDKVAYFRSDNAPEFPQPSDLAEFGIWRETIAAYLPELNGLAEVVNKLILQQIYRIVVTLGPQILKLIYYVIQYSITMINHTPRRSLKGQTPYGCYYQLSEGNFYRFPFAIDCVVTFSNTIEKNRYGVTSTKGAPSSIMGAVIGYASDCFSYYVLLKNMRCDIILSPNVRILRSYEVINSYLKNLSTTPMSHIVPMAEGIQGRQLGAQYEVRGTYVESEYDNTNDVMHMPKESYSVQPASFTLTTGNSSNEYVINDDPVQITIENPDDFSNPLQLTEESHDMVSEVKSDENPKPSLHELTPGDNPVSKPPQLGTETSVIGKSKEPITNHTKDAPSIQGRDHKRLESTAQVGLSHQPQTGTPASEESKLSGTDHFGVDVVKETVSEDWHTSDYPETSAEDEQQNPSLLANKNRVTEKIDEGENISFPGGDDDSVVINSNVEQSNVETEDAGNSPIQDEVSQEGRILNEQTDIVDTVAKVIENEKISPINSLDDHTELATDSGNDSNSTESDIQSKNEISPVINEKNTEIIQKHIESILADKRLDEFETYNVDEIENVINDDDIAEANPLPDENNDVQMNESFDNNHSMSRAKKKYTFEKEVNEKIAGTKHSLDTTDPREAIRVLNTGETKRIEPKKREVPITVKLNKRSQYKSPYVTRSGRTVINPKRYLHAVVNKIDYNDPGWIKSMNAELEKFRSKDVYEEVPIPTGVKPISMGWVHTEKIDSLKGVVRKSRCVVHGNRQKEKLDYDPFSVSSPVIDLVTIRLLTIIGCELGMTIQHLDVESAYLNASITHSNPIYVFPPKSVPLKKNHCWLLKRSVYGLKQSGFEWYHTIKRVLEDIGFNQVLHNDGLFHIEYEEGSVIYLGLYVDDILMVGSSQKVIDNFVDQLRDHFEVKVFGEISNYLGIEFRKTESGYILSQEKFLKKLLKDFKLDDSYGKNIPWIPNDKYEKVAIIRENVNPENDFEKVPNETLLDPDAKKLYQSGVGLLLWAATNTRPDISVVVNSLGSKSANPNVHDYEKLIYCLRYIKNSMGYHIEYKRNRLNIPPKSFVIECFSDASFAPGLDRKSISGTLIYVNGNLVQWATKKQTVIAQSSAACEMLALNYTMLKAIEIKNNLMDLGFEVGKIHCHQDNQAVIKVLRNNYCHPHRPIDICYKFLRQLINDKVFSISYVKTNDNYADCMTKCLSRAKFKAFVEGMIKRLDLEDNQTLIQNAITAE